MVVDDDPNQRILYSRWLERDGFQVEGFKDGESFLDGLTQLLPDAICLDLHMPGIDGLETLERVRAHNPNIPVVILTADFDTDQVVAAMRAGAHDYQVKPIERTRLVTTVRNAVEKGRLKIQVSSLEREAAGRGYSEIVGESPQMMRLFRQMDRIAASDINVLIHGESGTGKELVASGLHNRSGWSQGPFVAVNCAAIPESLQESEFFGHEKGAFTGATERRIGRFEEAGGGTLFLDEVAELDAKLQAKLLRVLQEHVVRRVGGQDDIRSEFRLIAATHRQLSEEVRAGRFREDLFYRLAVFELEIPPLRDRDGDLRILAGHFLGEQRGPEGQEFQLSEDAARALEEHSWPGNVRELENALQRAAVMTQDAVIRPDDLPSTLGSQPHMAPPLPADTPTTGPEEPGQQEDLVNSQTHFETDHGRPGGTPAESTLTLEDLERKAIETALSRGGSNLSKVARELGIGRTTLYRKLKKYGLGPGNQHTDTAREPLTSDREDS